MADWWALTRSRSVVVRAAKTSALVGTLLVVINHGDVLVGAGLGAISWSKVLLTFFVPYAVSTSSSVAALRAQTGPAREGGAS